MLEYWMQNGKAALSLIGHDTTSRKNLKEKDFRKLLYPLYQRSGKGTKLAVSLFYPIYNAVKEDKRNKNGFATFFHKQIVLSKMNRKRSCIYCGKVGAKEIVSYVFPFITTLDKYPNTYSRGRIQSLNLCSSCMVTSFAANNRLLFRANSPSRRSDHISAILFFSQNEQALARFYTNFLEPSLLPTLSDNINIFRRPKVIGKTEKYYAYDNVWYSEELLAVLIDFISEKITDFKNMDKRLGALSLSYNRVSNGVAAMTIYDSFDIIDDLYPFIKAFANLKTMSDNPNAFKILFRKMRLGGPAFNEGSYSERRRFFRRLLIHRHIDWKALQVLIFQKAGEDQTVPYLKSFILALMEDLSLSSEKTIFQSANDVGYHIGATLRKTETNPKRLKKTIYDFRRCRRPQELLDMLNLLQAQAETTVYPDPFTHVQYFETAKTGFLIGLSNAIFTKKR